MDIIPLPIAVVDDAQTIAKVLEELGRRVRAARTGLNLTQEKAAAAAGVDYKHWQELEAGRANATVETLVRVASALGMEVWDLLAPTTIFEKAQRARPRRSRT